MSHRSADSARDFSNQKQHYVELSETVDQLREAELRELVTLASWSIEPEIRNRAIRVINLEQISETFRNDLNQKLDFQTVLADSLNPLINREQPIRPEELGQAKLEIIRAMRGHKQEFPKVVL